MRHLLPINLIVVILILSAQPSHAEQPASGNKPTMRLTSHEHRLVQAVNAYRDDKGLEPLRVDPILMREARRSAPRFSHVINGKWCWQRTRQAGFRGWATDDIANGYPTPEDAVQGWATSHGHAMQMRGYFKINGRWKNYNFNRIGVGVSGRKYIAIFGRDNSESGEPGNDRQVSDHSDDSRRS